MDKPRKPPYSHLFTVRVWREELGDGQSEWRGKVKNVTTGKERPFREWAELALLLPAMLTPGKSAPVAE